MVGSMSQAILAAIAFWYVSCDTVEICATSNYAFFANNMNSRKFNVVQMDQGDSSLSSGAKIKSIS